MLNAEREIPVHIRWLIRRDFPEVLAIDAESHVDPWLEVDFLQQLRERNVIGMIAESKDGHVLGFMIYELAKHELILRRFAVHPHCRRHGIGTSMMQKLRSKLSSHRRVRIVFEARESTLDAHQFLKSNDFKATKVNRRHFDDTHEDAYHFSVGPFIEAEAEASVAS